MNMHSTPSHYMALKRRVAVPRKLERPSVTRDVLEVATPLQDTGFRGQRILREVCEQFGVTKDDLLSYRREKRIVAPRLFCYWRMYTETAMSLPQIGRLMGNRDHTTILHGIRRYEAKLTGVEPPYIANKKARQKAIDAQRKAARAAACVEG